MLRYNSENRLFVRFRSKGQPLARGSYLRYQRLRSGVCGHRGIVHLLRALEMPQRRLDCSVQCVQFGRKRHGPQFSPAGESRKARGRQDVGAH